MGDLTAYTPGVILPEHEAERALAITIARTPEAILSATEAAKPNVLANHAFQLAKAMARFYNQCKVLDDANSTETTTSRLSLVWATSRALETSLRLLGLAPVSRM